MVIGVQITIIVLFLLLGWAIRYKKNYWLVSGFANKSDEEQKQLIENGYPQKTGSVLICTAIGMLILLPLSFTSFLYTIEVQFGFMLLILFIGLIYISKFDIPKNRKKSYIISSIIFVVTIGFIVGLYYIGYQKSELVQKDHTFVITKMYGDEWKIEDIDQVKLLREMPNVKSKKSGFGTSALSKGQFNVEGYGSSLLFINHNTSPYIYIKVKETNIFINSKESEETKRWYSELSKNIKNN
jgi:hypothetical protein